MRVILFILYFISVFENNFDKIGIGFSFEKRVNI